MFRNFGAPEIILILVVVLLLFGAKRLPDTARGLGRSLRIFKAETKALNDDDDTTPAPPPGQLPPPPAVQQVETPPAVPATPVDRAPDSAPEQGGQR